MSCIVRYPVFACLWWETPLSHKSEVRSGSMDAPSVTFVVGLNMQLGKKESLRIRYFHYSLC